MKFMDFNVDTALSCKTLKSWLGHNPRASALLGPRVKPLNDPNVKAGTGSQDWKSCATKLAVPLALSKNLVP